jgi:hypothetical protein
MKQAPKYTLIVLIFIVLAGVIGWQIGKNSKTTPAHGTATQTSAVTATGVKSLVSYSLPDGWKEANCPAVPDTIYITPAGTTLNCNADPSAPIKIYVDSQGATDCQQLQAVQNVKKHICSSLYINGHKSLKALTEYPQSSSHSQDTTVSDYYINTGKGVVRVEYTYTASNDYQTGFEQLANSVKVN